MPSRTTHISSTRLSRKTRTPTARNDIRRKHSRPGNPASTNREETTLTTAIHTSHFLAFNATETWIHNPGTGLSTEHYQAISTHLFMICQNLNGFTDRNWTGEENYPELIAHLLGQLTEKSPYLLTIEITEDGQVQVFRIIPTQQCYEHGAMIDVQLLNLLKRRNQKLHALFKDFLHLAIAKLQISDFTDGCVEWYLDSMYEQLDEDLDEFESNNFKSQIELYGNILPKLAKQFRSPTPALEKFKASLASYHPRILAYKNLKDWISQIVYFIEHRFSLGTHGYPYDYIPQTMHGECMIPFDYVRFIWSYNDTMGHWISQDYSERMGNCNSIPLLEKEELTKENINQLLTKERKTISDEFYAWFSDGTAINDTEEHLATLTKNKKP